MSANTPLSGETAVAAYFVEDVQTTVGSNVSSEAVVQTVTASLENGRDYEVEWDGVVNGSVNANEANLTLRAGTTTAGTAIGSGGNVYCVNTARVYPGHVYGRFTAAATGSQSFVLTISLGAGSGTVRRYANSGAPSYLRVRRIG